MAANNPEQAPKKRRFYENIRDAYTLTRRSYPKIGWILAGVFVLIVGVSIVIGILTNHWIYAPIMGLMLALVVAMLILGQLMRKAMYKQLDGREGAVGAVLNQLGRGWIIPDQPVGFNRQRDLVWRLVGRPGVVLIGEGNPSRVTKLLAEEERKVKRVASGVPVHHLQVGSGEGQLKLDELMKRVKKLPKEVGKAEIPVIAQRLTSIERNLLPIPKGIDPTSVKFSRRALRGK